MAIIKKAKQPTLTERLATAQKNSNKALVVFTQAQEQLRAETEQLNVVIAEIDQQVADLQALKNNAVKQANANDEKVLRIAQVIG
jgi:hypothetical protein